MNFKRLITKKNTLIIVLVLFSTNLFALDKIELTWQAGMQEKFAYVKVMPGKIFTVNWGDGEIETETGYPSGYFVILSHEYSASGTYFVTIEATDATCRFIGFECANELVTHLSFTDCTALEVMGCTNNQLTQIDVTQCAAITDIYCGNNQLTNLDLSGCPSLRHFNCYDNQIQNLDLSRCLDLIQFICYNNYIKGCDLSGHAELKTLECSSNQLSYLIIGGCSSLMYLSCANNQLTKLDLSDCLILKKLTCHNNQLSLSDLYAASLLIQNPYFKALGSQDLPPRWTYPEVEVFADQSVFGGIFTEYVVEKNGIPALESDYNVVDGKLTFHVTGMYQVTMTNEAIVSNEGFPASATVNYDVRTLGIQEKEALGFSVYPNPTNGELTIDNGQLTMNNVELFDIYGRKQNSYSLTILPFSCLLDISSLPAGIYFLRVNGKTLKVVKQ